MTDQEINEAVALKLGYKKVKGPFGNPTFGMIYKFGWKFPDGRIVSMIPSFCHDIGSAWEVVEFINKIGDVSIEGGKSYGDWQCAIYKLGDPIVVKSNSAPMAICLALLEIPSQHPVPQ